MLWHNYCIWLEHRNPSNSICRGTEVGYTYTNLLWFLIFSSVTHCQYQNNDCLRDPHDPWWVIISLRIDVESSKYIFLTRIENPRIIFKFLHMWILSI